MAPGTLMLDCALVPNDLGVRTDLRLLHAGPPLPSSSGHVPDDLNNFIHHRSPEGRFFGQGENLPEPVLEGHGHPLLHSHVDRQAQLGELVRHY